jgi:sporadic carbohydrate cluster 2OG-Fe(II) oxygenase
MIQDILNYYDYDPDPRWDNKPLDYDTVEHNWSAWFLASVRELKPELPDLTLIHEYFKPSELIELRKHLEKLTNSKEFSQRLDKFFEAYVADLVDDPEYLVQSTSGIRIVVPNQDHMGRLLAFHTGYWTGYNNVMGTVWIPLTKAWGSNTMQVVDWENSKLIMQEIHNNKLSLADIQKLSLQHAWPVEIEVGQCWLFNQGHVHGNINNETGITRVSFDARWALPGYDLGPRRAGSFYRLQGTHATVNPDKLAKGPWIAFVDQNSKFIGETPHFMIREFLLGKANSLGLNVIEWSNEYWGCTWMPKLEDFVSRTNISGIIVPSIHAFSGNTELTLSMFHTAIKNGQQLLFVDENLLVQSAEDLSLVEKIYSLQHRNS